MLNSEHIKLWKWTHILSNKVHSEKLNYFLKQYSIASFDVICYILQKMRKENNQIQYHVRHLYTISPSVSLVLLYGSTHINVTAF